MTADDRSAGTQFEDVAEAITVLSRGLSDVLRTAPYVPGKVSLRYGEASLEVEWDTRAPARDESVQTTVDSTPADELHTINAPLVGTFYRGPAPDATPFIEEGDTVEVGQQVAIVEAMKLLNPIISEHRGRVFEVLVGDAKPVEYDQPLLVLEPHDGE